MCNLMKDVMAVLLRGEFFFFFSSTGCELPNLEKPFGQRGKCLERSYKFFGQLISFSLEFESTFLCEQVG